MHHFPLPKPAGRSLRRLGLLLEVTSCALALVALLLFFAAGQARAARASNPHPAALQAEGLDWQVLAPTGWVRQPVDVTVLVTYAAGLDPATASCEVSTDGGETWNPAPCTAVTATPTSVRITVQDIAFTHSSADENQVRFTVDDLTGVPRQVPNDGSGGLIIRVDNDPPGPPTGLVASPDKTWTRINGAFGLTWANPAGELAGIAKAHYKLDTPPTSNNDGAVVAGSDIHALSNLSVSGAGKHSIYVWLEDAAGNVDYRQYGQAADAFWYDDVAPISNEPQLEGTAGLNGWYRSSVVTVTLSASDPLPGSGVIAALHRKLDAGPWVTQTLSSAPYNWTFPVTGEGDHTLRYRAGDGAGNLEAIRDLTPPLRIDSVPPSTAIGWSGTAGEGGWFRSPVTVVLTPTDATSGWASTHYTVTWTTGERTGSGKQTTLSDDGRYQFSFYSKDKAGNAEPKQGPHAFNIDTHAPAITAAVQPALPPSTWYNGPVTVTLTASDWGGAAGSGLAAIEWRLDDATWNSSTVNPLSVPIVAADGSHTLRYRARDAAGNLSAEGEEVIKLDRTPPTVGDLVLSGTAGTPGSGWYVSPVQVTVPATDPTPGSGNPTVWKKLGAAPTYSAGPSLTVSTDGVHTIRAYAVDAAGNTGPTRIYTDAVKIDRTPPVISCTYSSLPNAHGWYTASVAITLTAADVAAGEVISSGVEAVEYQIDGGAWVVVPGAQAHPPVSATDGVHTLRYRARDVAGNVSAVSPALTFNIDRGLPTVAEPVFGGTPGLNGWYVTTGTVTLQAQDADPGSGVDLIRYRLDGADWVGSAPPVSVNLADEGEHTLVVQAVDGAGNVGPIITRVYKIDATPPQLALTRSALPNAYGWYSASMSISVAASDVVTGVASSGVDKVEYRPENGSWKTVYTSIQFPNANEGQNGYEAQVRDKAGNISATQPFTVWMDRTPPAAPIAPVTISPATCTNVNSFDVSWTNPSDLSGIDAVYYTVGVPPAPSKPPAGRLPVTVTEARGQASGFQVPTEGSHQIYIWLVDRAGNSHAYNSRHVDSLACYDSTLPTGAFAIKEGTLGCNGWYVTPVRVRLRSSDPSVSAFTYITTTAWVTVPTSGPNNEVVLDLPGDARYTLRYRAIDRAGNVQDGEESEVIWIDQTPPQAPSALQVEPVGWSTVPTFTVSYGWPLPLGVSGIGGGLYALDKAPAKEADGTPVLADWVPPGHYQTRLSVAKEGEHTLYFWLRDGACSSNYTTAVTRTIRYDGAPPVTTITPDRPPDFSPWYKKPVTLTLSATDGNGSGVEAIYYQINGGAEQTVQPGERLPLSTTGIYTITYYARDLAGRVEEARIANYKVDMAPPVAWVSVPASVEPNFTVTWGANDPPGNLVTRYWVEYRMDGGPWTGWRVETPSTSATFTGQRGHRYDFRARARDQLGNEGVFPDTPHATTLVNPINNGEFETLDGWQITKLEQDPSWTQTTWKASVVPGKCGAEHALLLGSPDYGRACNDEDAVPRGAVTATQTVDMPLVGPGERILLSFRYRIVTWDMKTGPEGQLWDTFEAKILTEGGALLRELVVDGGSIEGWVRCQERDLGCQAPPAFDVTSLQGQRVKLSFANWNRYDHLFNTWTYVEDVQLRVERTTSLHLPLIQGGGAGGRPQGAAQAPAPAPTFTPLPKPTAAPPLEGAGPAPTRDPRQG